MPNLTAGSLASKRSRIIGAIVPTLCNSWFADAMDGLAETLGAAGYQLMLGQSGYHVDQESGLVDAFLGRKVDGLVLTGVVHAPSVRERLRRLRLPVVEIWDLTDEPIDTVVGFSNVLIGEAVAGYLLHRGHRQIGFIGAEEVRSGKRLQGLRQRLAVVGFSDLAIADACVPALTSVRVQSRELGCRAAQVLLQRLAGAATTEAPHPGVIDLGFQIIERESA